MKHINYNAYDGYEVFNDKNIETSYKQSKLESCKKSVEFIHKLFDDKINVLELGSGNSKLLYNLSLNNLINNAVGVEISESRHQFAEKWKSELNLNNIQNINDDFINYNHQTNYFDLCVCVDLAFQFIEPIKDSGEHLVLQKINNCLNKNGKIILELDGCNKIIEAISVNNKIWEEFAIDDPWQFSLWDCKFDKKTSFLNWGKKFIHRIEKRIDNTNVILKIYTKESIV